MAQLNKTIEQIWQDDYVVPLYQRNYAWGEKQICQLIQDIYDSYKADRTSRYYIGSLVVLQRSNDGKYEVVDGQQRLTTMSLLSKALDILSVPRLSYDSRPEVEEFFKGLFYSSGIVAYSKDCHKKDLSKIYKFVDALDIIASDSIHADEDKVFSILKMDNLADFAEYVNKKVILVRTELPGDTDVAAYFEIMNNRGEQLQEHEIVKAMMLGKEQMTRENRAVFSAIWDACSQMDIPIQKTLANFRLNQSPLFGKDFSELNIDLVDQYSELDGTQSPITIDEVLMMKRVEKPVEYKDDDPENRYSAILDFPNFLMHVMKMFNNSCPLNADDLLDFYPNHQNEIEPMDFIKQLLKIRVIFDRYIIKASSDDEDDESLRWSLTKPYRSSNNSLRFRNTFGNSNEPEPLKNESLTAIQERLIKQESMLQVTFKNKKWKNWLFDILCWLGRQTNVYDLKATEFSKFIDKYILRYYDGLFDGEVASQNCSFANLGVNTPHFLFNFIDYLYWVESVTGERNGIRYIHAVKDFKFSYYSSVEHHSPQSYQGTDIEDVDNLGNLCLISRRKNSSLNNKDPKEKASTTLDGLQPKRRIMYKMTKDYLGWGRRQVEEHFQDVCALLNKREDILASYSECTPD